MDNQYTKTAGYRQLSPEELDLMVRIKAKGAELLALQDELTKSLNKDSKNKQAAAARAQLASNGSESAELQELIRFREADPLHWAAIGKTDIQTGIMALMRAVAQPTVA